MYDGLGSVVGEVDPSGNLTATKLFDVYGATRGYTGTPTTRQGFVGGLGHQTDDETGLIYMRAKYYDPSMGRFVSEDPSFHGSNWFTYCSNSPTNSVDQTGKSETVVNHVFGDDNFGQEVWDQFEESGSVEDFADWLMENFRGDMALTAGAAAGISNRFQLLLRIDSLQLEALVSDDEEIGVGDYGRVESIDTLIGEASEAGMVDLEMGEATAGATAILGDL